MTDFKWLPRWTRQSKVEGEAEKWWVRYFRFGDNQMQMKLNWWMGRCQMRGSQVMGNFIYLFFVFNFYNVLLSAISSVQFSSVAQSCPTLCNPMNCSMPGLPVHHQLPEFTQTHIRRVNDAIQPSHPLSSPSPPAPNPSQHQSLFQWVNSSHEVAKVLELQL